MRGKYKNGLAATPLQVMTGIEPKRAMDYIISTPTEPGEILEMSPAHAQKIRNLDILQLTLSSLHEDVK